MARASHGKAAQARLRFRGDARRQNGAAMEWKDVRLQVDVPPGWVRLDDIEPLTFENSTGLRLRLTPLDFPASLRECVAEKPLLSWALEVARQGHFQGDATTHVGACRFGLCASVAYNERGQRLQLWFLASDAHVLLVSLHGTPQGDELLFARRCVESMRLVPATQFPN
jgi:hypothetical protein